MSTWTDIDTDAYRLELAGIGGQLAAAASVLAAVLHALRVPAPPEHAQRLAAVLPYAVRAQEAVEGAHTVLGWPGRPDLLSAPAPHVSPQPAPPPEDLETTASANQRVADGIRAWDGRSALDASRIEDPPHASVPVHLVLSDDPARAELQRLLVPRVVAAAGEALDACTTDELRWLTTAADTAALGLAVALAEARGAWGAPQRDALEGDA